MTQTPAEQPSSTDTSTKPETEAETGTGTGTGTGSRTSIVADADGAVEPTATTPDETGRAATDRADSNGKTAANGSAPGPAAPAANGADITAEVLSTEEIRINGESHTVAEGQNPYREVYAQAHQHAQQTGAPAVVHGIDHVRGEQSWFSMSPEGEVAAQAQPGSGVGTSTSNPAQTAPTAQSTTKSEPTAQATAQPQPTGLVQGPGPVQAQPSSLDPAAQPTRAERRRIAEAGRPFVSVAAEKPQGGFRRFLYDATGGAINIGPSQKELQERELIERIARPLQGSHNTAVLSLKGGIGKTSTTVGVGMTLAHHRGDIPCAIDANPDSGDLVERALGERAIQAHQPPSITDLLKKLDGIDSLTALQGYLQQAGRLHVLAGEQDPALSDSLTAEEWRRIHAEFAKYYSVIVTDCGTGVTHNAMKGILHTADNIVIAAGFAVSGAQRALQTLNWLANHGYERLARESIVVITDKERVSDRVDKQAIQESLRGYCGKLVVVPFDRAVVDGDRINLDMLQEETRRAYMNIAAAMVDGYK